MRTRCVVLFVAAGLSLVLAQSASAADLSLPPPSSSSPPPSFFSWTGWYVGVNGGGGWGTTSHAASVGISGIPGIPALSTGNFNTGGSIAGGTLGYNYQFGHFLAGIETDLDWSNIRGTFNGTVPAVSGGTFSLSSQLQWLDTTRGRVGVVWDHALFYGTAGAAFGGLNATAKASAAVSGVGAAVTAGDTQTRFGWTAGGGIEYAFNNSLSGKVEYLYVGLGSQNQIVVDNVKFSTNVVRAGLNLHF
jgi:outer membrane immunogenic protein